MTDLYLPAALRDILGNEPYTVDSVGLSGSKVLMFQDKVLKIRPDSDEARTEHTMLLWLEGKLPAPRCLFHALEEGTDYLLMTRIPGKMACDEVYMKRDKGRYVVRLMADALKRLWKVDVGDCPVRHYVSKDVALARQAVAEGRADFEGGEGFADAEELLAWLENNQPAREDLVFSHGDYCMPNVLFEDGVLTGYIDLGNMGVADRWEDITMAYRSLCNNFSGVFGGKVYPDFDPDWLFEELDIPYDEEKFRYYNLLHELY
jgi:kanamycin kinase/aminoglycoside 3'-phosphotransferase-3